MNKIKAVFFDFGGTLAINNGSFEDFFKNSFEVFGLKTNADQINDAFKSESVSSIKRLGFGHDEQGVEKFWKEVYARMWEHCGGSAQKKEAVSDATWLLHIVPNSFALYEDVLSTLDALKEKQFHLGVLSNFDESLFSKLDHLGISSYFSTILCSASLGISEPSLSVFRQICLSTGLEIDQILYIGDSHEYDFQPCVELGMPVLLINRDSATPSGGANISTLAHVVNFLFQSGKNEVI